MGKWARAHVKGWARAAIVTSACGAVLLGSSPEAGAYHVAGQRWPGTPAVIHYYETLPANFDVPLAQAVAAWNASGVRVRFAPVTLRANASLLILPCDATCSGQGLASIGHQASNYIKLRYCAFRGYCTDRHGMALVIAHEMGHVLGLDHQLTGCATMNPVVAEFCAKPPRQWLYRCRLLQQDDLNGAAHLYGGRTKLAAPQFCELAAPPLAPSGLLAERLEDPVHVAKLTFTTGARDMYVTVVKKQGSCPADAVSGADQQIVAIVPTSTGKTTSLYDDWKSATAPTSPVCYRFFPRDQWDRRGPAPAVWVTYP